MKSARSFFLMVLSLLLGLSAWADDGRPVNPIVGTVNDLNISVVPPATISASWSLPAPGWSVDLCVATADGKAVVTERSYPDSAYALSVDPGFYSVETVLVSPEGQRSSDATHDEVVVEVALPEVDVAVTEGAIVFNFVPPFGSTTRAEVIHYSGEPYPKEWLPLVTREVELVSDPVVYFERKDGDVTGLLTKSGYELNFHVIFYDEEKKFIGEKFIEVTTPTTQPQLEVLNVRLVAWPDSTVQGPGEYRVVSTVRNIGAATGEVVFYTFTGADGVGSEEGPSGPLVAGEVREISTRPLFFLPGTYTLRAIGDVYGVLGQPKPITREFIIFPIQPRMFSLAQNYPNPFNASTVIEYQVATTGHTTLTIYNVLGQVAKTLVDSDQQPGAYRAIWDGTNNDGEPLPSGLYLCRATFERGGSRTIRMFLTR